MVPDKNVACRCIERYPKYGGLGDIQLLSAAGHQCLELDKVTMMDLQTCILT